MVWSANQSMDIATFGNAGRNLGRLWLPFLLAVVLGVASPDRIVGSCVEEPLEPDAAQVQWRWIGLLDNPEASCADAGLPPSGQWSTRRLFSSSARIRWPALRPFCLYEHESRTTEVTERDLAFLDVLDGTFDQMRPDHLGRARPIPILTTIEPDAMAVAPAGALGSLLAPELETLFLEQAGQLPANLGVPTSSARLTLIDTSPTSDAGGATESSDHGRTLSGMAERLLCPGPTCVADVRTRLALGYTAFDPKSRPASAYNATAGGYFGLIGDLAMAIVEELDDWTNTQQPDDRLVLNLSVAWDPLYGGGDGRPAEEMPAHVRAVRIALEIVACNPRAVAVAAAGNLADRHRANSLDGPLLPAAWGRDVVSCAILGKSPLVVAAGAVDRLGHPVANAIDGGMPELVAYGDHATAGAGDGPAGPPTPLTGSSVSALVVSSAVAVVGAYRPDLSLDNAARLVYSAGRDLSRPADFCPAYFGSGCPNQSYVSLCRSVARACASGQGECPPNPPTCVPRPSRELPTLEGVASLLPEIDAQPFVTTVPTCAADCGDMTRHWNPLQWAPSLACPSRLLHGMGRRPFSHPQPQSDMCPNCTYVANTGVFLAEIEAPSGQTLGSPSLVLRCGGLPISIDLSGAHGGTLMDGDQLQVVNLPLGCDGATLTFAIEQGGLPVASGAQPALVANAS